ncbi:hypothetical protein [Flavobacterium sp. CS20]|uniref:hypothetical protein n=1 Tax=Flavobacterium sp. CS20 TaxID=2775246 RepID=UPI001B3A2AEB|nr:hypothetical protein [Flavobacterium sp. CS20]QTY26875.1 hypothetical protein IGB25_13575 [Flavobacterium sp. CS20]
MYNLLKFPLLFFILSLFLVGCTSEEVSQDLNEITNEETSFAKRVDFPDLNTYLSNKYPNGYTFGYERTFTEDDDTFVVKEVFANGATEVTGFVNLTNDDFTQYLELQRARDMIWIDDFVDGELYEFDASDPDSQEFFVQGFLENSAQQTSTANRFWGWQCGEEYAIPEDSSNKIRNCCYYVIWSKLSKTCKPFSSNNLPGSNPRLPQVSSSL